MLGKCYRGRAQPGAAPPFRRTSFQRASFLFPQAYSWSVYITFAKNARERRSYHPRVPSELLDPAFGFYDFVDLVFESGELVQDRQAATALVVKDSFYLAILVD